LNCSINDSPPAPLSNPTIGINVGSFIKQFNHWKEIMDYFENGVPLFNGQNGLKYEIWSRRMKVFLKAWGELYLDISCYRI
jgi:hypothetical protein